MISHLHRAANERPTFLGGAPEVGTKEIKGPRRVPSTRVVVSVPEYEAVEGADKEDEVVSQGYSFFDSVSCPWRAYDDKLG